MRRLKAAGYYVVARVIAANERDSMAGIHRRYEEQKAAKGFGRWSNVQAHNDAYKSVPATLEYIERHKLGYARQVPEKGDAASLSRSADRRDMGRSRESAALAAWQEARSLPDRPHGAECQIRPGFAPRNWPRDGLPTRPLPPHSCPCGQGFGTAAHGIARAVCEGLVWLARGWSAQRKRQRIIVSYS